jgi:hypothetical protein
MDTAMTNTVLTGMVHGPEMPVKNEYVTTRPGCSSSIHPIALALTTAGDTSSNHLGTNLKPGKVLAQLRIRTLAVWSTAENGSNCHLAHLLHLTSLGIKSQSLDPQGGLTGEESLLVKDREDTTQQGGVLHRSGHLPGPAVPCNSEVWKTTIGAESREGPAGQLRRLHRGVGPLLLQMVTRGRLTPCQPIPRWGPVL